MSTTATQTQLVQLVWLVEIKKEHVHKTANIYYKYLLLYYIFIHSLTKTALIFIIYLFTHNT